MQSKIAFYLEMKSNPIGLNMSEDGSMVYEGVTDYRENTVAVDR